MSKYTGMFFFVMNLSEYRATENVVFWYGTRTHNPLRHTAPACPGPHRTTGAGGGVKFNGTLISYLVAALVELTAASPLTLLSAEDGWPQAWNVQYQYRGEILALQCTKGIDGNMLGAGTFDFKCAKLTSHLS